MKIICKNKSEKDKPVCILGVATNDKGMQIRDRMMQWLPKYYRVVEVHHDGSQFEYPALHVMQIYAYISGKPCLYVHTRGAYNHWKTTEPTHRMWEFEFGQLRDLYFRIVDSDKPIAACPFTGPNKETFYNGFVANAAALKSIDIQPSEDRMIYERIFKGSQVKVFGKIFNNLIYETLTIARHYLYQNYI